MHFFLKLLVLVAALTPALGGAADLFVANAPVQIKPGTILSEDATIGGYPLYFGDRKWLVVSNEAATNNLDIHFGYVTLLTTMGADFIAAMRIGVNLNRSEISMYYSGEPCHPNEQHLFKVNKGSGRIDNCLTIDPYVFKSQDKSVTQLKVWIRNTQSSNRLYNIELMLNLPLMGFPDTNASDWTERAIEENAVKKAFIEKVKDLAVRLQTGVSKAIAFNQPKDAFEGVPPLNSLLPTATIPQDPPTSSITSPDASKGLNSAKK